MRNEVAEGKAPRSTSLGPSRGRYGILRDEEIVCSLSLPSDLTVIGESRVCISFNSPLFLYILR